MKSYHQKFISDHPLESTPMAEIAGFPVRPGIFDLNGASPLQNGVNFTIHTCGGLPVSFFSSIGPRRNPLRFFLSRRPTRSEMSIP